MYEFVYAQNEWWLRINNLVDLSTFYENTQKWWDDAIEDYEHKLATDNASYLQIAIGNYATIENIDFIDAASKYRALMYLGHGVFVRDGQPIYFNKNGVFTKSPTPMTTVSVRRHNFIFPDYAESNIRVMQDKTSLYWFGYIGDLPIEDGNINAWETACQVRTAGLKYVTRPTVIREVNLKHIKKL